MFQTISSGARGAAVRYAQQRLRAHGYDPGTVDGIFGARTRAAVVRFQAQHGVDHDGIVGAVTWALLEGDGTFGRYTVEREDLDRAERARLLELLDDRGNAPTWAARSCVETAIAMLGLEESPRGSNWSPALAPVFGEYATAARIAAEKGGRGPAWCSIFAVYCVTAGHSGRAAARDPDDRLQLPELTPEAFARAPFGRHVARVADLEQIGVSAGVSYPNSALPRAGDLVTMARGSSSSDPTVELDDGHCAVVVAHALKPRRRNGPVVTVEGNVAHGVRTMERSFSEIRLILRPLGGRP